jgi:16S rRNA G527 N7-methylase RsmG
MIRLKGRLAYALNIKDSKVKLLKGYTEVLEQWNRKQNNTNSKKKTSRKTVETA